MSILGQCVLLGLLVILYGVTTVLGSSWKKLRLVKLSLCLKLGTPKGQSLKVFDVSRSVVARL